MPKLVDFNPLKSIAIPDVGRVQPRGLIVVIGPNSSGKTQMLKDIQARLLGQPRKLVVCEDIEIQRPQDLDALLGVLYQEGHIRKRVDANNHLVIDSMMPHLGGAIQPNWSLQEGTVRGFYQSGANSESASKQTDKFLEHFGRSFMSSLFLDRRLVLTNTVDSFDYENSSPTNELQTLYLNLAAKQALAAEAAKVFGKAIWLDNTRANKLCLRVADEVQLPSAEDRLEPEKMRKYRLIEDEGDGFKSYMGTCVTLLLGERPVCLIDEPEMCLHPPQAYALGRFIGRYGVSTERVTFVATHSSHVLRGVIEQTRQLEIVRLARVGSRFSGKKVSHESIRACIEKPSTKVETILDGLFAEAVTVVESEGDRLVYSTTWEKLESEFRHDVHFVSVGGTGGIADTCRLYRNLKIPVSVIADLDLLRELDTLERVVTVLASSDAARELMVTCREIITQVRALGPIHGETELQAQLKAICEDKLDWSNAEQLNRVRRTLSELSDGLSQTARLKSGVESLSSQAVYHGLKALLVRCQRFGLHLVPCGELEDWVPSLMVGGPSKKRKPEWANAAANRIREAAVGTDDIWAFIRQMGQFQRDEVLRLAGSLVSVPPTS
ncbi:MAG: AAA family ATPase [Planctomycetes bacterium]|nr:AAA family ATPase [Planctomycetota bacterium]